MGDLSKFKYFDIKDIKLEDEIDHSNLIVYKGVLNGKDIAIKEYNTGKEGLDDTIINELNIGTKVSSARLLEIYGYSHNSDKTKYYLLMEYINQGSVYQYINRDKYYKSTDHDKTISDYTLKQGCCTWNYIMSDILKFSLIISILKAIKSMYDNNIIHGDIKPCNLVIHKSNDNLFIKVIDYGTCIISRDNIDIDCVVGTDGYYAPEQEESSILDHKSDIYSIGVSIIEIWNGSIWKKNKGKFNETRNDVLRGLRNIKKNNTQLEKLLKKCIDLNYKKRPDIYKLYDEFIKLSQSQYQM